MSCRRCVLNHNIDCILCLENQKTLSSATVSGTSQGEPKRKAIKKSLSSQSLMPLKFNILIHKLYYYRAATANIIDFQFSDGLSLG